MYYRITGRHPRNYDSSRRLLKNMCFSDIEIYGSDVTVTSTSQYWKEEAIFKRQAISKTMVHFGSIP